MFKTLTAKALLGVGVLASIGGGTALAASPAATGLTAAVQAPTKHTARDVARGVIQVVSDTSLTIERHHRAPKAAAGAATTAPVDGLKFVLTPETKIVRWSDRKTPLGRDALKVGERVGVRFVEKDGQKVAKTVVILPDLRGGIVTEKHPGGFTIRTHKGDLIHVTVKDTTQWYQGRKGKDLGNLDGLKEGDRVVTAGTADGADKFDAARVRYWVPTKAAKPVAPSNTTPTPAQ